MKITSKTKYADVQTLEKSFSADSVARIKEAAENHFGAIVDLTFDEFWRLMKGDTSGVIADESAPTLFEVYYLRRFRDFADNFAKLMQKYTIAPTADERTAANGLIDINFDESALTFIRDYFSLKSFREAAKITIGEYLIAKRAKFNADKFARNMSALQLKKMKRK